MLKPVVEHNQDETNEFVDLSISAINCLSLHFGCTGISAATGMITFCAGMAAQFDKVATAEFLRVLADMLEKDARSDPDLEAKRAAAVAKIYRAYDLAGAEPGGSA